MKQSWVYMTTNKHHTVIYAGVTSNLTQRIHQHKNKYFKGFTSKYNCDKLIYYKEFTNIIEAIKYEKTLKAGNRAKKEKLINEMNPQWKDLFDAW